MSYTNIIFEDNVRFQIITIAFNKIIYSYVGMHVVR